MNIKHLFLLFIILFFTSAAHSQDTIQWTGIMGGNKAGFLKKWKTPDGYSHEWFQYNDRGRGDSTVVHYKENESGFIVTFDGKGKDYLKKPVFEKFSVENGVGRWENNSEKGDMKIAGDVAYIPLKINAGTSYKNFFTSADSSINLLPNGTQKIKVLRSVELPDNKTIRLFRLSGIGLTPSYGWMDENFEHFGFVSDWLSLIKKGYEGELENLLKIQNEYEQTYYREIKTKSTQTHLKIAIVNASVFDPVKGGVIPDQTILIENGIIKEVSNKKYKLSGDYKVVDAAQKFVMAGLWDMHVHFSGGSDGLLHIACGVTNVRDMGNSSVLLDFKKQVDEGTVIGPRVQIMSGIIDGTGPFAIPMGSRINSAEEGKEAVKNYASKGYQQIKLYSSIKPEWVKPIADEVKKNKMRLSGHIPAHMLASEAIDAGYDEIQHINMVFLNFYGKELDTRTPARFTTVAQKAAFFDFNSPEYKKFIEQLKEKKTVVDPTVTVFENMFTHEDGKPSAAMAMVVDRLPLELQRSLKSAGGLGVPNGLEDTYKKSFDNMLKMVKALYDNGITIVVGTDGFVGFTLHRELENYVRAGIPPAAVLKMATLQAAQVSNKATQFGSIEKGKVADIILLDGNPLENISNIRKTNVVIKDKTIYQVSDLFKALSIKP